MKKTIVVAHINYADSQGDKIMPGAVKKVANVPLTKNFQRDHLLGFVDVYENGDRIFAEVDVDEKEYKGLYPAIGFKTLEKTYDEDGTRLLHSIQLMEVSLCSMPNADEQIKPI